MTKLAIDVHYQGSSAFISGVMFSDWASPSPDEICNSVAADIADYQPGAFYKRELPCILKLLTDHNLSPTEILIDGHVYLDGVQKPGLGAYLFDALGAETPVIGIGKNKFKDMPDSFGLLRGQSEKPIYITAAGLPLDQARAGIKQMHGKFRLPTLLKLADQACRKFALGT